MVIRKIDKSKRENHSWEKVTNDLCGVSLVKNNRQN